MKVHITGAKVKAFHKLYAKKTGVRFVQKSVVSKLLRLALSRVPNKYAGLLEGLAEKLRPCALKNWVVLTFCFGVGTPLQLLEQICIATHEVGHVFRIRDYIQRGGRVSGWYADYFRTANFRAIEEGVANAAEAQVRFALTGEVAGPALNGYLLTRHQKETAYISYDTHMADVLSEGRGATTLPAATVALACLRQVGIISQHS